MYKSLLFIFCVVLFSCSFEEPRKMSKEHIFIEAEINTSSGATALGIYEKLKFNDSTKQIIKKGKHEFTLISDTALSNKFSDLDFSKVIIYELTSYGFYGAESVFKYRTGNYKVLDKNIAHEFLKLISKKESYNNAIAACFDPRVGLVFYDSNDIPVKYVSICLSCNYLKSNPSINYSNNEQKGFTIETRKKLHKLLEKSGLPDTQYSELFDDAELKEDFLKSIYKNDN